MNLQSTRAKALDTYSADFFIGNFFFLSALGIGAAPKALANAGSPVEGGVCPGGATAMITIELKSAGVVIASARP
jgi:hypothetical protein